MDAGLAKVLNSTIGTSAVKALDTLMKESDTANVEKLNGYMTTIANNAADRLYNKLKSEVRLVGSDEVLIRYTGGWTLSGSDRYLKTAKGVSFSHAGTVVAKTVQYAEKNNTLNVYKDSSFAQTSLIATEFNRIVDGGGNVEICASFNVVPGTVYYFEVYCYDKGMEESLDLCATPYPFGATATIS